MEANGPHGAVLYIFWVVGVFYSLVIAAPAWVPIAFIAYAFGRRGYTTRLLLMLMTAEAIAIAVNIAIYRSYLEAFTRAAG